MKLTRTFVLIISIALFLSACNNESDDSAVAQKENINPLLSYVPSDTAYVFADLEPAPAEITDAYVKRFQPVLDVMSEQVKQFQADYQAGEYQDNPMFHLATAVLDELDGEISTESINKLGISLQAHHAFYATGVFPVMRLELNDAQQFRNAIARIEGKMGYQLPVKNLNGDTYWRVGEDGESMAIYIAILDQQLAVSAFPVNAEDRLLAAFLGQQMPAESIASSNALGVMNRAKGYTAYGSGFLDIQKLADEFLNAESKTRKFLGAEMNAHMAALDDVCVAEIKSIASKTPRMTSGLTRLTTNEVAISYDLEIESSLASGLAGLVSKLPSASSGDHLLSASLAIKIGKLRNFVLEQATAVVNSPYQCAKLQQVNDQAVQLMSQLNIPMPPMINNLMGLRVRIDDFDPSKEITEGDGLIAIHVDKPEMFVGMASMMVPGFEELDLANQTEPVRIPAEILQMEGLDVFAMMTDSAIGASIGELHVKDLANFMNMKPRDNDIFFSIAHDMSKQMEIQAALAEQFQPGMNAGHTAVNEYAEAVKKAYKDVLGRSRVDMRFTTEGLRIDNSLTFK